MPKICYRDRKFQGKTLEVIKVADALCQSYASRGMSVTLRQLYYLFVSRGLIPNRQQEYDRLGAIVNDARLAGLIDWNHLEDRTRNVRSVTHWDDPAQIIRATGHSYKLDKWAEQPAYVECWIEKDALVGTIDRVCNENDIPYFSCRGYVSQSEMWGAAQRIRARCFAPDVTPHDGGEYKPAIILHLGDHDPSGIDMSRDIGARLSEFLDYDTDGECQVEVRRLALNMAQVREYNPPPNPAKLTDSRVHDYLARYGSESWELDALTPEVLAGLVQGAVDSVRDSALWSDVILRETRERGVLEEASRRWGEVAAFLGE